MSHLTVPILVLLVTSSPADAPGGGGPAMNEVVQGNTAFGLDLYGRLSERRGNLFFSPFSISNALAMTSAGARGETAEQMIRALRLPKERGVLDSGFRDLIRHVLAGADTRPYKLFTANALWGQRGEEFSPAFINLLRDAYQAGLFDVDFRGDPSGARRRINAWVEEQTRGKITDLLKRPAPSSDTSLVLTNAIYFKGAWTSPFSKGATKDEDFRVSPSEKVPAPFMHQLHRFGYVEDEKLQVVDLPYAGGDLAMVVLLPKKVDGLGDVEKSLTPDRLAGWLGKLSPRQVDLALPRFKTTAQFELKPVLSAMGMPLAFGNGSDFSGINGRRDLYISAVIHKAYVDVNEEGTEAAAATAVVTAVRAARPQPPVSFRADHPFVFLIRDGRSGSILFLGRVENPKD